jgi:hypothetical protein
MTLSVSGLPALPADEYYAVYLVRQGSSWEPCGWFTVSGPHAGTTVAMNAPYDLQAGGSWVVTRHAAGAHGHGRLVLRPTT